jgi:hypothetical protein
MSLIGRSDSQESTEGWVSPPWPGTEMATSTVVFQLPCGSRWIWNGEPVLIDFAFFRDGDDGCSYEGVALIGQDELVVLDLGRVFALFLQRILHFEEVGEVGGGFDMYRQVDRLVGVVEDGQFFGKAGAYRASTNDRLFGVDVHRSGAGYEEESGLEVLKIICGQRRQALIIYGEHPAGEKAGVEGEQAGGVGQRCLNVTALVGDDKGVAVEDSDLIRGGHAELISSPTSLRLLGGPGKDPLNREEQLDVASADQGARAEVAAIAFSSPVINRSKSSLVGLNHAVRIRVLMGDREVTAVDRDQPVVCWSVAILKIKPNGAFDLGQ